jgi:hypothetical protein
VISLLIEMIIASRRNDRAGAPRCQSNRLCAWWVPDVKPDTD